MRRVFATHRQSGGRAFFGGKLNPPDRCSLTNLIMLRRGAPAHPTRDSRNNPLPQVQRLWRSHACWPLNPANILNQMPRRAGTLKSDSTIINRALEGVPIRYRPLLTPLVAAFSSSSRQAENGNWSDWRLASSCAPGSGSRRVRHRNRACRGATRRHPARWWSPRIGKNRHQIC